MLRFSLEVVLSIVSHMNHYTVVSLLTAVPEYSQYAVFVTDHDDYPLFFDVGHRIERRYFPVRLFQGRVIHQEDPLSGVLFTPDVASRYPIRMYEFFHRVFMDIYHGLLTAEFGELHYDVKIENEGTDIEVPGSWKNNPGFNGTSFIFVNERSSDCESLCTMLELHTESKWHTGLPTHPPAVGTTEPRRNPLCKFQDRSHTYSTVLPPLGTLIKAQCVTLRLENVPVISRIELPNLRGLVLIYNGGSDQVPVIERLVVPNICRLIVHYDGQVPLFRMMGRLTTKKLPSERKIRRSVKHPYRRPPSYWKLPNASVRSRIFELCHIDSVGGFGGARSRDSNHHAPRKTSDMSFDFLKRFHKLVLTGVPWFILEKMNTIAVSTMSLTMTETAGEFEEDRIIELPKLEQLTITIKADNFRFGAKFKAPGLFRLVVRVMGLNPNLDALWSMTPKDDDEFKGITDLQICSNAALPYRASITGGTMYTITEVEKAKLIATVPYDPGPDEDSSNSWIVLLGFPGPHSCVVIRPTA